MVYQGYMAKTMSVAVGAYFKTLRENKKLSQDAVGKMIGLSGKQVYNWERGSNMPSSEALVSLMAVIGGSVQHLAKLFQEASTEVDGEQLAYQWLSQGDIAEISAMPDDELVEMLSILGEIRQKDSAALTTVRQMLRGLAGR